MDQYMDIDLEYTLNSSKTEFLLIGNRQQLSKIQNTSLNTCLLYTSDAADE